MVYAKIGAWLSLACLVSLPLQAAANQEFPKGPVLREAMKSVDLDKDQKQKIKEIRETRQNEIKTLRQKLDSARDDLRASVLEGASSDVLRKAFNKMTESRKAMESAQFEMFLKTFDILTSEQRKIVLQKLKEANHPRHPSESLPAGENQEGKNADLVK